MGVAGCVSDVVTDGDGVEPADPVDEAEGVGAELSATDALGSADGELVWLCVAEPVPVCRIEPDAEDVGEAESGAAGSVCVGVGGMLAVADGVTDAVAAAEGVGVPVGEGVWLRVTSDTFAVALPNCVTH